MNKKNIFGSGVAGMVLSLMSLHPAQATDVQGDLRYRCSFTQDCLNSFCQTRETIGDIFVAADGSARSLGLIPIVGNTSEPRAMAFTYSLSSGSKRLLVQLIESGGGTNATKIVDAGTEEVSVELRRSTRAYRMICALTK